MHHRHNQIVHIVNEQKRVMVKELSVSTGVSEVTIRQDLNYLEKQGFLKRVHGAAMCIQDDDVSNRMEICFDAKQELAEKAALLVAPGETILIEGGSANALLARVLSNRKDLTIITPSVYIAHLLRNSPVNIILLGGVYQHQSESLVGPLTKACIQQTHFSTAFIGVDGFHCDTGFTSRDMMRAEVVSEILAKNIRNVVLTDASKFGQIYSTSLGELKQFSTLVTNKEIPPQDITYLQSQGVETILI